MKRYNHEPVMVQEVLELFRECELKVFFDGTVGAGGHAKSLLESHPEIVTYIGCDRDPFALQVAHETLRGERHRVKLLHANFAAMDQVLKGLGIEEVDGVLLDLGVSSMQFDQKERGFSFRAEGPLDMRMDSSEETATAREIVNTWSEQRLAELFREYGEEPRWRKAAMAIVAQRKKKKIETAQELADIVAKALGTPLRKKRHPATLIFQALRLAVNRELEHVQEGVAKALHFLSVHGRMGVLSFHSLEDRIVKNLFRAAAKPLEKYADPLFHLVTKKPRVPHLAEVRRNPRARSAKLRAIEKT